MINDILIASPRLFTPLWTQRLFLMKYLGVLFQIERPKIKSLSSLKGTRESGLFSVQLKLPPFDIERKLDTSSLLYICVYQVRTRKDSLFPSAEKHTQKSSELEDIISTFFSRRRTNWWTWFTLWPTALKHKIQSKLKKLLKKVSLCNVM